MYSYGVVPLESLSERSAIETMVCDSLHIVEPTKMCSCSSRPPISSSFCSAVTGFSVCFCSGSAMFCNGHFNLLREEFFSLKTACSCIVYCSHSKKNPNNLVIGSVLIFYDLGKILCPESLLDKLNILSAEGCNCLLAHPIQSFGTGGNDELMYNLVDTEFNETRKPGILGTVFTHANIPATADVLALLCGVLLVIIQKLRSSDAKFIIAKAADQLMHLFLLVFARHIYTVHEEAMLARGSLAYATGSDFAMVRLSTLHRTISKDKQLETQEEAQEETRGKLVYGDGFSPPAISDWLDVYVGAGVQFLGMLLVTMVFAVLASLLHQTRVD
jgi:hypothetical protein